MPAYVIFVRSNTHDLASLEKYAAIAKNAPTSKIELVASSKLSPLRVLEGPTPDSVVVMKFPSAADALEWYHSDAYKEARVHRLASADFQAYLIEG